jgi:hypothetical protein
MKRWTVQIRRGDIDIEGPARGNLPIEAFLKFVRRKKVWPAGAGVHLERFPGGDTYHAWPAWKVGNGLSLGDRWVVHITPEE